MFDRIKNSIAFIICLGFIFLSVCSLYGCDNGTEVTVNKTSSNDEIESTCELPWVIQNKNPADYSWDEYEKLTYDQKEYFYDTFSSDVDFENWMIEAQKKSNSPWLKDGKKVEDYTWEEFQKLSDIQKELFYESFKSNDEFDKWMKSAKEGSGEKNEHTGNRG